MAMKVFKITLIIILLSILVNAVRQGEDYPILQTLPLLGGWRPFKYQIASIIVVCITVWGCHRLRKNRTRAKRKRPRPRQPQNFPGGYGFRDYYGRDYRY
jgi:hypothetical protein